MKDPPNARSLAAAMLAAHEQLIHTVEDHKGWSDIRQALAEQPLESVMITYGVKSTTQAITLLARLDRSHANLRAWQRLQMEHTTDE